MRPALAVLAGVGLGVFTAVLLISPEDRLALTMKLFGKPIEHGGTTVDPNYRPPTPVPIPQKDPIGQGLPVGSVVEIKKTPSFVGGNVVVTERFPPPSSLGLDRLWSYKGQVTSITTEAGFLPTTITFIETDVVRVVSRPQVSA